MVIARQTKVKVVLRSPKIERHLWDANLDADESRGSLWLFLSTYHRHLNPLGQFQIKFSMSYPRVILVELIGGMVVSGV